MIERLIDLSAKNRWFVILSFVAAAFLAVFAARRVSLDAIPDLSDTQVIIFTEWEGRAPTSVEDQVTYPLVSSLLAAPKVVDVRGLSMAGMSFVYVIFEEGTDVYWARSRVVEYLASIRDRLPSSVTPVLGPDATGIGWVYAYALVDRAQLDLFKLRSLQDYTLRFALESVPGVAQVASVGGNEKQYQISLDPKRMRQFGVTADEVIRSVRRSNRESSGRLLELGGREYFLRGRANLEDIGQIGNIVVKGGPTGPVLLKALGTVKIGSDDMMSRGWADLNGRGSTVGGIVVARYGENALDVIQRVKAKLEQLKSGLPKGVEVVPVYDRSNLIWRSIGTLRRALFEEGLGVSLVIILFLLHLRSAFLPILSLPLAVLLAFVPMYLLGIPATIMSLGGIAIAIGATVDAEIVMIEACHKKLENAPPNLSRAERARILAQAAKEVTPAIFFSLLIIAVSFVPVFGLTGQAGRLFRPLAYTKTFVMVAAALLSITLAPALRDLLLRGKIRSEKNHPVSRIIHRLYAPFVYVALRRPLTTVAIGVFAMISAIPIALRLGDEFMPPLEEGDILYMPTTMPNLSIEEAQLQVVQQDQILMKFPEVRSVFGKAGRAETATDPAPISMVETVVQLKHPSTWPKVHEDRWYSAWAPTWLAAGLRRVWPEERTERWDELTAKMNAALELPGWTNAWTMPIKARVDMMSTGIRTPIGIKIFGSDLAALETAGKQLERVIGRIKGTRSALYDRSLGGTYLDVIPRRDVLARYGLQTEDINAIVELNLGGEPVATIIEGRQRNVVSVGYKEDQQGQPESHSAARPMAGGPSPARMQEIQVPLPGPSGQLRDSTRTIRLGALADVKVVQGPPMIRDEAGSLVVYVYVDIDASRDVGGYVEEAKSQVEAARRAGELSLAPGMYLKWTGQYEALEEMRARMKVLVPLALLLVVVLLYLQFRQLTEVLIVLLSIPFALVGSFWMLHLLDYRLSTAVWVGLIAMVGLAAQTGIVMIVYIDQAFFRRLRAGKIRNLSDIVWAHMEGTVQRVRPKLMTVATMLIGLVPLLWATDSGADTMKRIAAPMVGGLITSAFLTLEIIPVIYTYWRYGQLKRAQRTGRTLSEICGLEASPKASPAAPADVEPVAAAAMAVRAEG